MAQYKCPFKTCNINFTGAVYDILPRAVGHAQGSHQVIMDESDVSNEIEKQANPKEKEEKKIDLDKWWNKINKE